MAHKKSSLQQLPQPSPLQKKSLFFLQAPNNFPQPSCQENLSSSSKRPAAPL
jgi:hypothetical protein